MSTGQQDIVPTQCQTQVGEDGLQVSGQSHRTITTGRDGRIIVCQEAHELTWGEISGDGNRPTNRANQKFIRDEQRHTLPQLILQLPE